MTDWDDLRYFLALARLGSVTMAATHLSVNHSTVSRRISAMEEKHGVRLFERLPKGYRLTLPGENIYQLALELEQKNQHIERLLFAQDARLQGQLTLTAPHDVVNHCVIPFLGDFYQRFPDIELKLIASPGLKDLNAREADIAIRLTASPPDYLIGKKLANLRHGIYQSKHYQKKPEEPDRLVLWRFEQSLPAWALQHYVDAKVALRVDDLASMYAAVKAGLGLARMPCYLPDLHNSADIQRLDLALKPSSWGLWLLSHVDLRDTQRVKVCKQFLQQCLSQQKDLFEGKRSRY